MSHPQKTTSKQNPEDLDILFAGGCGAFGMNLTIYKVRGELYMVDCGMMFPSDHLLGIDCICPNLEDYIQSHGGIHSYLLTHGHEDHIGALPLFLKRWPAPYFATEWTLKLIESKLKQYRMDPTEYEGHLVKDGEETVNNHVKVIWSHVTHSIPMSCSLLIETQHQRVFHTGDFKFDLNPPFEKPTDFEQLSALGQKGIDILICDSTNAGSPGWGQSETDVQHGLMECIRNSTGRIYVTTFSSNLWRLGSILSIAKDLGKKVGIAGMGIERAINTGFSLELLPKSFESIILNPDQLQVLPRSNTLIIASGSQGEHRAALAKLVSDQHPHYRIERDDTVIFSARAIPGNEGTIQMMASQCHKRHAKVVTTRTNPEIHASGHAHRDEILELIKRLKPSKFIPIHGTNTQLVSNCSLGESAKCESIKVENGTILTFRGQCLTATDSMDIELQYVDSWSKLPMNFPNLRQRLKIGDSGLMVLSGVFNRRDSTWPKPLQITLMGIQIPKESEWMEIERKAIQETILEHELDGEDELLDRITSGSRKRLTKILVKKPVVLCEIHLLTL